ncbi:hypothetical protein LTR56_003418 [Elasticomyces elasticus]|nr:hypothetical protein LTR56_003418 [Elasticomyces elasticus]KAK4931378.1 hypothetical protein LTR49_002079 [Elasticomyces elasticus]KAK5766103.1 hypothetical protein LTS12_003849 [Elasticomyces elasticus]
MDPNGNKRKASGGPADGNSPKSKMVKLKVNSTDTLEGVGEYSPRENQVSKPMLTAVTAAEVAAHFAKVQVPPTRTQQKPATPKVKPATPKTVPKIRTIAADYTTGNAAGMLKPYTPRTQVMKWTAANDRKLMMFAFMREISPKEYAAIAASFPEGPTPKAVQERLTKLRKESILAVREIGLEVGKLEVRALLAADDVPEEEEEEEEEPQTNFGTAAAVSAFAPSWPALTKEKPTNTTIPAHFNEPYDAKEPKYTIGDAFKDKKVPYGVLAAGVKDLLARQKAEMAQGVDGEQKARDESVARGADVLLASAGDDDDFLLASTADDEEEDAPDEMEE